MGDPEARRRLIVIGGRIAHLACGLFVDALIRSGQQRRVAVAGRLAATCEALGGAFHKAGQVLATRSDLLGDYHRAAFARLCDNATPDPYSRIYWVIESALPPRRRALIAAIDPVPIACGSVAQIHRARLAHDDRRIALKVRRPGVAKRFRADLTIAHAVARTANRFQRLATYPLVGAISQLEIAVVGQLDFVAEARAQRFFCDAFASWPEVVVPNIIDELCSDELIGMELIESGRRIDDPDLSTEVRVPALRTALRCLYAMIFRHGRLHCDLHPGNLLVTRDGKLALLDFGYIAVLPERERRAFAELFLAVSLNDPYGAARVVANMGTSVVESICVDKLADDLSKILDEVSGTTAERFQITSFVVTLFEVQRRYGLRGDPGFTMAIMSLLTIEGLLKTYTPTLDFQREAIGYVSEALEVH